MKNKTLILSFILILNLLFSPSQSIDLKEENISDDKIIIGDTIYRIVHVVEMYFLNNGEPVRKYVVEDWTKINELKNRIQKTTDEIEFIDNEIETMEKRILDLKDLKEENSDLIQTVEKQKIYYENWLGNLTVEKQELENKITSNLLVSPNSYRAGVVVIIILLILLVVFRGSEVFEIRKKKKKGQISINQTNEEDRNQDTILQQD